MKTYALHRERPYNRSELGSLGNASYMLIRKFQFPLEYSDLDKHYMADHDRVQYSHANECFQKHTGTGELGFQRWLGKASDDEVFAFIVDILQIEEKVDWTGYRITGTVHRGDGAVVYTLELFWRHPNSKVDLFSLNPCS